MLIYDNRAPGCRIRMVSLRARGKSSAAYASNRRKIWINQPSRELIAVALQNAKRPIDPKAQGKLVVKSISSKQRPRRPA